MTTIYQKIIKLFKRDYFIYPVEEWYAHFDAKYEDWGFGRVEVCHNDEMYAVDEYRYLFRPSKRKLFYELAEKVIPMYFNWFELQAIRLLIKVYFKDKVR